MTPVGTIALDTSTLMLAKRSARSFGLLLKAFILSFAFCGIGSAVAPLVFIGMILGMFPNIIKAAFAWLVTAILLILLPLHAIYALGMILSGKAPDYGTGIYGAAEWVEANRLYDPTFVKKADTTLGDQASKVS